MNTLRIYLSAITALFIIASCTKPVEPDPPLLQDGPNTALGKQIHLPKHYGIGGNPVWGKNDDELFLTTGTEQALLRLDLNALKTELVNNNGFISGRTNEHTALIFTGTVNNQLGYYTYGFNSGKIELVLPFTTEETAMFSIAANNIFYYRRKNSPPGPRCDGFCTPPLYNNAPPETLHHVNKLTGDTTDIINKLVYGFSKDGSKTILTQNSRVFLYDNPSAKIIDSFNSPRGKMNYDDVLKSYEVSPAGEIIITEVLTKVLLDQYTSQVGYISNIYFSADGTKIYYTGRMADNQSSRIIIYDLNTKKETVAVSAVTEFSQIVLSDSNKKIFFRNENDYYIKELN